MLTQKTQEFLLIRCWFGACDESLEKRSASQLPNSIEYPSKQITIIAGCVTNAQYLQHTNHLAIHKVRAERSSARVQALAITHASATLALRLWMKNVNASWAARFCCVSLPIIITIIEIDSYFHSNGFVFFVRISSVPSRRRFHNTGANGCRKSTAFCDFFKLKF